jgi:hypothetical protein
VPRRRGANMCGLRRKIERDARVPPALPVLAGGEEVLPGGLERPVKDGKESESTVGEDLGLRFRRDFGMNFDPWDGHGSEDVARILAAAAR